MSARTWHQLGGGHSSMISVLDHYSRATRRPLVDGEGHFPPIAAGPTMVPMMLPSARGTV